MYNHIRDNSPTLSGVSSSSDSTLIKQAKKDLTSEEELLCVVCNSQASGRHYGQYSCEGCKSFFKRSIRRSISYTCRGNKDCIIDVSSRNQCQFCRLKKSIRMGMRKEVQRARIQASSLPYSYNLQGFSNIRSQSYFPNPIFSTTSFTPVTSLPSTSLNSSNIEHIQNMNIMRQIVAAENFLSNVLINIHLKDKQLMYPVVHYARCIEAFTCMNFEDQITLLKSSWYHLFLLHYYSFPMFGVENSLLSNQKSARYYKIVVDKLRSLKLDSVECGCIKALLLFSQDNRDLLDGEKVELIQDRILYSFEEYVKTKDISGTERRFAKLLMLLSSIKSVDSSFIIHKYLPNLENNSHCFEPLIREILLPAEQVTDVSECSLNPNNLIMCSTSALAHQLPRTSNLTSRLQAMPMNVNNFTNSFWTYFPFGNIFPAQPKPDGF